MRKRDYTVSELVHTPSFRRTVEGTASSDEIEKWNRWIEESDQNRAKAKLAVSQITGFEFADPEMPDIEQQWSKLQTKTIDSQKIRTIQKPAKEKRLLWAFRAAAVLMIISIVGLGVYLYSDTDTSSVRLEQITQERTISTQQGEQKSISFSNDSKIVLHSNSTLTYSLDLLQKGTINVNLQGTAFFDAENSISNDQSTFIVSTPDGKIRDIGTEFLVAVEKDRSRVVLQEGLVKVETMSGNQNKIEFEVGIGEMVEFSKSSILTRKQVNSTFYTSWATGSMTFEQTEVRTFANFVEKRFGVKVEIVDPDLADIKIDGAVYFKSLEGLMRSVSEAIKIPVYQSEDQKTVYVGERQDTQK